MSYVDRVRAELHRIQDANRYRTIPEDRKWFADFSTNDYLGLAADSRMAEAMRYVKRAGSGGARLLGGAHREHTLLEQDLASWLGRERALLFSSGYLAALGVTQVLGRFADVIYSDELNHASLIDGIRASGKPRAIFPHLELPPRERRRSPALIVTESLFGMDGDLAPLEAYLRDLNERDILLVDDAHAVGILGERSAGLAAALQDDRVVVLGTLGKAIGASGGFIAGNGALIELLINSARTFIFDTAIPPALAFAARVGVMLAKSAEDRRARLFANARKLDADTPIVPVVVGSEARALEFMQVARERSVNAPAIRPPTVPEGGCRLRISVRADHTNEQIDLLLECLRQITAIS